MRVFQNWRMRLISQIWIIKRLEAFVEVACREVRSLVLEKSLSVDHLDMLMNEIVQFGVQDKVFANAVKGEFSTMDRVVSNLQSQSKDMLEEQFDIKLPFEIRTKPLKYLYQVNKTKQRFADYFRGILENSSCTYDQMNLEELKVEEDDMPGFLSTIAHPNIIGEILFLGSRPRGIKALEKKCLCECIISSSRLIMALNKFEKRNGQLPQNLEQLTPEYSDAVPRDPFDGDPFRYNKEKGVVYSVGKNLEDDGGSSERSDGTTPTCKCRHHLKEEDIVFSVLKVSKKGLLL